MLTKALIVKATVFSVVMYRCESWTIKKPEHWRTDDLELWYWRRLLRVLGLQEDQTLVNSEGNQLWIFTRKTNALALAKPPVLWPPDVKSWLLRGKKNKNKKNWCWERLKAGGEGDDRGSDGWIASLAQWIWVWMNSRRCGGQGSLLCYSPWGHNELDMTEWLNNNKLVISKNTTVLTYLQSLQSFPYILMSSLS